MGEGDETADQGECYDNKAIDCACGKINVPVFLNMCPDGVNGRSGKLFARPEGTILYELGKNGFSEYCKVVKSWL